MTTPAEGEHDSLPDLPDDEGLLESLNTGEEQEEVSVVEGTDPTVEAIIARMQTTVHSGPMPSADEALKYKEVDATFPNRMMIMAESALAHSVKMGDEGVKIENRRIGVEDRRVGVEEKKVRFGYGALLVYLAFPATGIIFMLNDYPFPGMGIALAGITPLIVGPLRKLLSALLTSATSDL